MKDDGAVEGFLLPLVLGLTLLSALLGLLLHTMTMREQAQTAADFAALGAAASPAGCAIAFDLASRNGATLDTCSVTAPAEVRVRVITPTHLPPWLLRAGTPVALSATAHATTLLPPSR